MWPGGVSDGGEQATVDDVHGAGHLPRPGGREEGDELGDLVGVADAAEGDAELCGEDAARGIEVGAVLLGEDLQAGGKPGSLDDSGRDDIDPDAARPDLVGQALAVGRQRGFGAGLGQRCRLGQAGGVGADVHDGSAALFDHGG